MARISMTTLDHIRISRINIKYCLVQKHKNHIPSSRETTDKDQTIQHTIHTFIFSNTIILAG